MFKLMTEARFTWPIKFKLPSNGGSHEEYSFDVSFKLISDSAFNKYVEDAQTEKMDHKKLCREVIVGWEGIQDEKGNELSFSKENLDKLLETPTLSIEIATQYFTSFQGARAKN